jgi:hypothetical protein
MAEHHRIGETAATVIQIQTMLPNMVTDLVKGIIAAEGGPVTIIAVLKHLPM